MVVVGSGIAAQELSPGVTGLELLENALATGAGLVAIIYMVSWGVRSPSQPGGLHRRRIAGKDQAGARSPAYIPAQILGCIAGAIVANVMFSQAAVSISTKHRASGAHFLSEIVATTGLLVLIFALVRSERRSAIPLAVGAYIAAAYFFTSSTSFANPAITIGRMFSNSFAGIAPSSAPLFIAAQLVAVPLALVIIRVLYPALHAEEQAA